MNISTTEFVSKHCHSKKEGNYLHGRYAFHCVYAYNDIKIDDIELRAHYETGELYNYEDYDCPSNELELSEGSSILPGAESSEVLIIINKLYESDFDDDEEKINDVLEEVKELCPVIDSADKLYDLYMELNANKPDLWEFLDLELYTENLEDYIEDENGYLRLKDKN
jgi:hypothetical protein